MVYYKVCLHMNGHWKTYDFFNLKLLLYLDTLYMRKIHIMYP